MSNEDFPSTPDDAKELGMDPQEDPDFALSEGYYDILSVYNTEASEEQLSSAAVELTRLLEPLALSDRLVNFHLDGVIDGLLFEIDQND